MCSCILMVHVEVRLIMVRTFRQPRCSPEWTVSWIVMLTYTNVCSSHRPWVRCVWTLGAKQCTNVVMKCDSLQERFHPEQYCPFTMQYKWIYFQENLDIKRCTPKSSHALFRAFHIEVENYCCDA